MGPIELNWREKALFLAVILGGGVLFVGSAGLAAALLAGDWNVLLPAGLTGAVAGWWLTRARRMRGEAAARWGWGIGAAAGIPWRFVGGFPVLAGMAVVVVVLVADTRRTAQRPSVSNVRRRRWR